MKNFIKCAVGIAHCFAFSLLAEQSGQLTTVASSGGGTFYGFATWYSDSRTYTNGGTPFTLPANFSETGTPVVVATVQPSSYSSSSKYYPLVTSVSSSSVTIRVNNDSGEAATDEVIVHISVTGKIE